MSSPRLPSDQPVIKALLISTRSSIQTLMKISTQETPASPATPTVIFILAGYSTVVMPEIPVLEMVIEIIQVKGEHILVLIKC